MRSGRDEIIIHYSISLSCCRKCVTNAWPNVVRMESDCSGVVIHPEVVVYAAHCGLDQRHVTAGVGHRARLTVDFCDQYPDWDIEAGNDLAFCVLSNPAPFPFVPPAIGCETDLRKGDPVVVAGYGTTSASSEDDGLLRAAAVSYSEGGLEIPLGDEAAGSCFGDSGGPAFGVVGTCQSG